MYKMSICPNGDVFPKHVQLPAIYFYFYRDLVFWTVGEAIMEIRTKRVATHSIGSESLPHLGKKETEGSLKRKQT